jgi:hypothetical protein
MVSEQDAKIDHHERTCDSDSSDTNTTITDDTDYNDDDDVATP